MVIKVRADVKAAMDACRRGVSAPGRQRRARATIRESTGGDTYDALTVTGGTHHHHSGTSADARQHRCGSTRYAQYGPTAAGPGGPRALPPSGSSHDGLPCRAPLAPG